MREIAGIEILRREAVESTGRGNHLRTPNNRGPAHLKLSAAAALGVAHATRFSAGGHLLARSSNPGSGYGLTVNGTEFEPAAPHPFEFVAVTELVPIVWAPGRGLYT